MNAAMKDKEKLIKAAALGMLLCILCFLIPVTYAGTADEDTGSTARDISDIVEKIYDARMESLQLREKHQNEKERIEQQISRLEQQLKEAQSSAEEQRRSVKELERDIESLKQETALLADIIARVAEKALSAVQNAAGCIEQGIPFKKHERLSRAQQIEGDLKNSEPKVSGTAAAELCRFFTEELRLGRSVDIWNEPVLLENGAVQKDAFQVRIGLVTQLFLSEDGKAGGVAAKEKHTAWIFDLEGTYLPLLRNILDILQNRKPPALVPVPITIPEQNEVKE